jgi:hypothetical protein
MLGTEATSEFDVFSLKNRWYMLLAAAVFQSAMLPCAVSIHAVAAGLKFVSVMAVNTGTWAGSRSSGNSNAATETNGCGLGIDVRCRPRRLRGDGLLPPGIAWEKKAGMQSTPPTAARTAYRAPACNEHLALAYNARQAAAAARERTTGMHRTRVIAMRCTPSTGMGRSPVAVMRCTPVAVRERTPCKQRTPGMQRITNCRYQAVCTCTSHATHMCHYQYSLHMSLSRCVHRACDGHLSLQYSVLLACHARLASNVHLTCNAPPTYDDAQLSLPDGVKLACDTHLSLLDSVKLACDAHCACNVHL